MRLIRCNRCGVEAETPMPERNVLFGLVAPAKIPAWSRVIVEETPAKENVMGRHVKADMCEDCREVFVEQFMKGAKVEAITQTVGQNPFPHDDILYQDCLLAFDPERGRLICEHDDPARFHKLCRDRAQNVAEGVPEQKVETLPPGDYLVSAEDMQRMDTGLLAKIGQLASDMQTAGYAHSVPQRCSEACSEQHTYERPCLMAHPVRKACPHCQCIEHLGLRCSSTGCECLVSTDGENLTAAYSEQEPVGEGE